MTGRQLHRHQRQLEVKGSPVETRQSGVDRRYPPGAGCLRCNRVVERRLDTKAISGGPRTRSYISWPVKAVGQETPRDGSGCPPRNPFVSAVRGDRQERCPRTLRCCWAEGSRCNLQQHHGSLGNTPFRLQSVEATCRLTGTYTPGVFTSRAHGSP